MARIACPECGAQFEVDFAPGTRFRCGSCQGIVTVPEAHLAEDDDEPVVTPARRAPAESAPSAERAPREKVGAARRPGAAARKRPAAGGAKRPAKGKGKGKGKVKAAPASKTPMYAGIGVGAVAVIGILIAVFSGPSEDGGQGAGRSGGGKSGDAGATPQQPAPPQDPYVAARQSARTGGDADAIKTYLRLAEEKLREAQAAGESAAVQRYEKHLREAWQIQLEADPSNEDARTALGFVRFDLDEAKAMQEAEWLPREKQRRLRNFITDIADEYDGRKIPTWLRTNQDMGREWKQMRAGLLEAKALAEARRSDPFYAQAESAGRRVVMELTSHPVIDFKLAGVNGAAFEVIAFKPYVFCVQNHPDRDSQALAEQWYAALRSLQKTFYELYTSVNLPEVDVPTPVVLLQDGQEYTKYLRRGDPRGPVSSAAHFEPANNRIVSYLHRYSSSAGETEEVNILFHEGTHQLMHFLRIKNNGAFSWGSQAFWFDEGIAEFFGGHATDVNPVTLEESYRPGTVNVDSVRTLKEARKQGVLFKFEDLLGYLRRDEAKDRDNPRKGQMRSIAYAQGWGLVFFLQRWGDGEVVAKGKYLDRFATYLAAEATGRSGPATFKSIIANGSDSELKTIEREFERMLDFLIEKLDAGKIKDGEIRD